MAPYKFLSFIHSSFFVHYTVFWKRLSLPQTHCLFCIIIYLFFFCFFSFLILTCVALVCAQATCDTQVGQHIDRLWCRPSVVRLSAARGVCSSGRVSASNRSPWPPWRVHPGTQHYDTGRRRRRPGKGLAARRQLADDRHCNDRRNSCVHNRRAAAARARRSQVSESRRGQLSGGRDQELWLRRVQLEAAGSSRRKVAVDVVVGAKSASEEERKSPGMVRLTPTRRRQLGTRPRVAPHLAAHGLRKKAAKAPERSRTGFQTVFISWEHLRTARFLTRTTTTVYEDDDEWLIDWDLRIHSAQTGDYRMMMMISWFQHTKKHVARSRPFMTKQATLNAAQLTVLLVLQWCFLLHAWWNLAVFSGV